MSNAASVGRIVHVLVDPATNNGADIAPAVITRVWGEAFDYGVDQLGLRTTVNVRVLLDQHDTLWLTSITLVDERPSEEALAAKNPHNPKGYSAIAFWPPRVS